jgi:anti-sigma factor ChrR (cupin superfamily)
MGDGLKIRHIDDVEWTEVRAQTDGTRRRSVWNRFISMTPERAVIHTRYDPGMVLPRHAHKSEEVIYVLEGDLMIGDTHCPTGTVVILEPGTSFGPLIAGDEGCLIFEVFRGTTDPADEDPEGFRRLLDDRGVTNLPHPPFTVPVID